MANSSPSTEFCLRLARVQATLSARLDRALGAHHGIGFADYQLLLQLQRAPGGQLPRAELAARLGLTPSGVTRSLLPLEKIGLLKRDYDALDAPDARAGRIRITASGDDMVTNATLVVDNVSRMALGALGRERIEAVSALLAELERP